MDKAKFYTSLRRSKSGVFGNSLSRQQVEGVEGLLRAFATHGDDRAKTLAYGLATAYHETGGRMVPVREGFAKSDAGARRAVARLAKRRGSDSAVARYALPTPPHGHVYYGRGHVQLTWLKNYIASSDDAGYDLAVDPDKMLDPEISARVLWRGLQDGRWNGRGRGIAHYLPESGSDDLRNARRTVNVTDKWDVIARYYRAFFAAIREAGEVPKAAALTSRPIPDPKPVSQRPTSNPPFVTTERVVVTTIGVAVASAVAWWTEITTQISTLFGG